MAKPAVLDTLQQYVCTDLSEILSVNGEEAGEICPKGTQDDIVQTFKASIELVPAYRKLIQSTTKSSSIPTVSNFSDFESVAPFVTKSNYLHPFPLSERCIGGTISPGDVDFLHVSSGSTGEPTFWARAAVSEIGIAARFEQIFADAFNGRTTTTLCVVAFPLGSWVGGIFTTFCLRYLAMKNYPITIVTPGNNVPEILKCTASLAPMFNQTCILGYPPFVKAVIDAGLAQGLPWSSYALCMVLAGEVFSEEWRQLVAARAGISQPLQRIVSIYGTADAGVIGTETPLSASIRAWFSARPDMVREFFGADRLPTLIQYDPSSRYLELTPEGTLAITASDQRPQPPPEGGHDTGIVTGHVTSSGHLFSGPPPLLRYHIGDKGGVVSFSKLLEFVKARGYDAMAELAAAGATVRKMPLCWVFGRAHWAVSLYGANVFVDQVMVTMERPDAADKVTGKFKLSVTDETDSSPRVRLHVELSPSLPLTDPRAEETRVLIQQKVKEELLRVNSEFKHYVPEDSQLPEVLLRAAGDPELFPVGVKHKWTF